MPPFLASSLLPNLLLLIDNSASMYDLAYYNDNSTACYDDSYTSSTSYAGYFDTTAGTYYQYNAGAGQFEKVTGTITAGSCTVTLGTDMCINHSGGSVSLFKAKGNFLNWLTMSKFDIQKKILTGGKYVGQQLVAESRGCNHSSYVKAPKNAGASIGITFGVRGALPAGGNTYIDIMAGSYNTSACNASIEGWVNKTSFGSVKQDIKDCMNDSATYHGVDQPTFNHILQTCWGMPTVGTGDINRLENSCDNHIYGTYLPSQIVPSIGARYYTEMTCSSVASNPPYDGTTGYIGKCKSGSSWTDSCVETETRHYCGDLVTLPTPDPLLDPVYGASAGNFPAMLSLAGLYSLGSPMASYPVKILNTTAPTGIIQNFSTRIRFGAMVFNSVGSASESTADGSNGIPAASGDLDGSKIIYYMGGAVGDHTSGLIGTVDNITATTWTPFAEAYYDVIGYFANRTDMRLNTSDFNSSYDPVQYSCQKNNVLLITDGMSTADNHSSVRSLVSYYNDGDGLVTTSSSGTGCAYGGSKNLDDLTWLAYNRDIRAFSKSASSTTEPSSSSRYITTYVVFNGKATSAAGECNPQTLLIQAAANGGTGMYQATDPASLEAALQDAFSTVVALASSGTTVVAMPPTQSRESFTLAQGYFYPSEQQGSVLVQWIGYLRMLWADVIGNIRENTDTTGESTILKILDLIKDKILAFVYSAVDMKYVAKIYTDANGDSVPESCTSTQKASDNVTPLWEAGALLKAKSPVDRTIKIWFDSNNNDVVDSGEFTDFDTSTSGLTAALKNIWNYSDMSACDDNCSESVIKYIRGYDFPTPSGSAFRPRQSASGSNITTAWKMGDIIFSTPRIASNKAVNAYDTRYSDMTYKAFLDNVIAGISPIAVVGANDGMLHAFRVGTMQDISPAATEGGGKQIARVSDSFTIGDEVWSFIPKNAAPYLRWYCQETYCHIPMVDTTFTIVDASIGEADNGVRSASSWRRLLIGAMGFGGTKIIVDNKTFSSSIFVMDITSPLNPTLLWEKKLPDNTLTTGTPGIVRLGASDKNGSWYLLVGSGPAGLSTSTLSYTASPKMFVFNLKDGSQAVSGGLAISGASNAAVSDIMVTDMDYPNGDYQSDGAYFGTYGGTGTAQTGKFYRLRIRNGSSYTTTPADWSISTAVDAGRPVFGGASVAVDSNSNRWVYFGTGLYVTTEHIVTDNNTLYGFKETDGCWKTGSGCSTYSNFLDTSVLSFQNAQATNYSCVCSGGVNISTGVCQPAGTCSACGEGTQVITATSGATLAGGTGSLADCNDKQEDLAVSCVEGKLNSYDGWKSPLIGQKMYSVPLVAGGIVGVTLFTPSADPCQLGGTASIMALHYTTGTTYSQPAIQGEGGTTGTASSATISRSVQVAYGAPPFKQSLVAITTGDTYKVFTQASGGITSMTINPSAPLLPNGYVQWLTK